MEILYDGAILQTLRRGGVARYFTEVWRKLPENCRASVIVPDESFPEISSNVNQYRIQTEPPMKWMRAMTRSGYQRRVTARFDSIAADVEHWTYYNGLCRRPIRHAGRPLVVTVHDFIHEAFPTLDPSGDQIRIKYDAIRVADHLACVSKTTYQELCERFPAARKKASVIPHGTSLADVRSDPLPGALRSRPYVLYVGRRDNYKNFEIVWRAWKRIRDSRPSDARLVIVGPKMKSREAKALDWNGDDRSVKLFPDAPDTLLKALYQCSDGFLFPSLCEGFGLPSLEAMSLGAPVLVSDLPVMREVVGDGGYYFDPKSENEIASMMLAAVEQKLPDHAEVVRRARQRASNFTWQSTTDKTVALYNRLAGSVAGDPLQDAA